MECITTQNIKIKEQTAVTIGNFDGIHMGHRKLIETCKRVAEQDGLRSAVLTFSPHPMFILGNRPLKGLIMSYEEKRYIIESLGVDYLIEYPFDEIFAKTAPEDFIKKVLKDQLNCRILVLGEDYHSGSGGQGNIALLKETADQYKINVTVVSGVDYDNERVSSTRIRQSLKNKDLDYAAKLLTRPYFVMGTVQEGRKIGRTISFPTINIVADEDKLFPENGVYATRTIYKGDSYDGVTNIGVNPTVGGEKRIVETHLFDFDQSLYGEKVVTLFYQWIRNETKFSSLEELKNRIKADALESKVYLSQNKARGFL